MIQPLRYEPEYDVILPIMPVDDDMPLISKKRPDYYIETEEPIKPYEPTPVVVTKPVIMPRPVVLEDVIVPIKPKVEFNPTLPESMVVPNIIKRPPPFIDVDAIKNEKNLGINPNGMYTGGIEVDDYVGKPAPDGGKNPTGYEIVNGKYALMKGYKVKPKTIIEEAKSINPLYIVGGIVAAILVYKILK